MPPSERFSFLWQDKWRGRKNNFASLNIMKIKFALLMNRLQQEISEQT